jgi:F-type H+-transporting ATPase subunit delta
MTLIKRYTEGFIEYAEETIGLDRALDELKKTKELMSDNPELKELLANPAMTYDEKCGVIERVFGAALSEETRNFLKLLLKKGRIDRFGSIAEYAHIRYSHGEKVSALLYTSYVISTEFLEKIKNSLENRLRLKLQLYVNLDPEMLGGVRVVCSNKVLDGSVRKRLDDLKRKLMAAKLG